jgi:hypothetical protein
LRSRLLGIGRAIRRAPARPLEIRGARVLSIRDRTLVLEFEVPESGFLLPPEGTTVDVFCEDGT